MVIVDTYLPMIKDMLLEQIERITNSSPEKDKTNMINLIDVVKNYFKVKEDEK